MGLSVFENALSSPPYCSPSIDRSLTTRLIELSNSPSKSSSRFAHTPDWADGLDIWSSSQTSTTKTDLSRRNLEFHHDIGLYLPRYEKPRSAPIGLKNLQINPKVTKNNLPPERIRHLLKREKDLLSPTDVSDQQSTIDIPPQVPTNTFRSGTSKFFYLYLLLIFSLFLSATSLDLSSTNDNRLPLRHVTKKSSSPDQQLNQGVLKNLLEEHLTSLLTRGASTINPNRTTIINVPSVEMKQKLRTDSKLIDERYTKRDDLNSTPLSSTSSQLTKTSQTSHFIVQHKLPLGLTVTPVETSSQKHFSSVSLEKLAQQKSFLQDTDSSSAASSRPSTEPGFKFDF